MRPANVVTAVADVLAGYAIAGLGNHDALPWLVVATACLYAGGVTLNDYFDRRVDAVERPERPIPSGRVPPAAAASLGFGLLAAGVAAACVATVAAGAVAACIAALVLAYDTWTKHHRILGPITMGLCRALNLLLGVAAVPPAIEFARPIALVPLVYIATVTALSRGEVRGGGQRVAGFALISLSFVLAALAAITASPGRQSIVGVALVIVLAWRVVPPFWRAYRDPSPGAIRHAVKAGVLSLVLIDAAIGAAYAGALYSAAILATALVATALARLFSVT